MITLSVIIISKNAEEDIRQCLESVKWADEIIVLDSGSSDDTLKIASEYTSQIFSTNWPGFGPQKNRALAKAQGKWVLSIDADEILSNDLIDEIKSIIHDTKVRKEAYSIKRISYFCGKKIKYGDWGHDEVIRLFLNKSTIQFSPVNIHEKLIGYSSLGHLKQLIFHDTMKDMSQVLNKLESYSTCAAQLAYEQRKKGSLLKACLHGIWCFIRGYFLRGGFLDGREGFILAFSNSLGVFYRYIKLIYLYSNRI